MSFISTEDGGKMSYIIIRFYLKKNREILLKTTNVFFVFFGVIDLVLWIMGDPKNIISISNSLLLAVFAVTLGFELLIALCDVNSVKQYFRKQFERIVDDKYQKAVSKYSNSAEKDLLFTIADGLHQKQSFRKINKHLKETSNGFYSLTLKRRKNTEDCDLVLIKHYKHKTTSNRIRFSNDLSELEAIADQKIENSLDRYSKDAKKYSRELLESVLFALTWMSLGCINGKLKSRSHASAFNKPNLIIQVQFSHKSNGYSHTFTLELLCNNVIAADLVIYEQ